MLSPSRSAAPGVTSCIVALALAAITLIGGPLAASAQALAVGHVGTLAGPIDAGSGGLEVDAEGNVYTADFGATLSQGPVGTRVFKVTPTGDVTLFAEGFRGASGNAIDEQGRFFQANIAAGTVDIVGTGDVPVPFVTSGLQAPVGLVFDLEGRLMVANCGGNTISRVDAEGNATEFARSALLQCPNGLVRDEAGNFYVSNFYNGDVLKITSAGAVSRLATVPGNNNGHLVFADGVFYVAARSAHQIYELTMDGQLRVVVGSGEHGIQDGPATQATLSYPNDLALSPDGRLLYWNDVHAVVEDAGQTLAPTVIRMLRLR